jgi:hypothetical protein
MSPELRRKAKLLRKLKPDHRGELYDHWWTFCVSTAEDGGCRKSMKEFLTACGISKETLFWVDRYVS